MKYLGILILLIVGCNSSNSESPELISWSSYYVKDCTIDDLTYEHDHENFIRDYLSVKYENEKIIASTLIEVNCRDSIQGAISVSNDTIYLKSEVLKADEITCCTFHTFRFVISNPENKRYTIISSQ